MIKETSRTLAIGDIHGCLVALNTIEKVIGFNASDTIIALGDYIDRGNDSMGVLDWMLSASKKYNLITLLGNHEQMMQEALNCPEAYYFWIMNGGDNTLDSFNKTSIDGIPKDYWEFIKSCKLFHETDSHIFVHAGLEPSLPPAEQKSDVLCWLRFRDLKPHVSSKMVICGHTPQRGNVPGVLPYGICIDTYAFSKTGYLTCLDVNTGEFWQANNKGEFRKSRLDMLQNSG
jgi:serine/threonine protein phosphatase 1